MPNFCPLNSIHVNLFFTKIITNEFYERICVCDGFWLIMYFTDKDLMNAEAGKKQTPTQSPLVVNVPKSTPGGPSPAANNSNNGKMRCCNRY